MSKQIRQGDSATRNRTGGERLSHAEMKKERRAKVEQDAINHQTFMKEQIMEFYDLFELYSDKNGGVDINDILATARTLGLDEKYQMVYKVLSQIQRENHDEAKEQKISDNVNFNSFIDLLTFKLGNINDQQGREAIFKLLVDEDQQNGNRDSVDKNKLLKVAEDLRYNLSDEEAQQIIHNVAGFQQTEFDFEQFEKFIQKKLKSRKEDELFRKK